MESAMKEKVDTEITTGADVAIQPFVSVTVFVIVPGTVTIIEVVFWPVDQKFPVVLEEVSVTEPPGMQREGWPVTLMVAFGSALIVKFTALSVPIVFGLEAMTLIR